MFSTARRAFVFIALLFGSAGVNVPPSVAGAMPARTQDACPVVRNFFPRIGYPGYGVILEGRNFQGVTEVKFANDLSARFELLNAGEMSAVIPTGAVSGPITIVKAGCPDAAAGLFTIAPAPALNLDPTSQTIPPGGTASINIDFGSGLFAPAAVLLESSNPNAVSVPPFLLLPLGGVRAAFTATALAETASTTITAALPPNLGGASATATISVVPTAVRVVRVGVAGGVAGSSLGVPIETEARGDEQATQFSLTYDPAALGNPRVSFGMSLWYDTIITTDLSQLAQGRIGIVLNFPPGQPLSPGNKQIAMVRFDIAANAAAGETPIGFDDRPTTRQITSPSGARLSASFAPGKAIIER